MLFKLGRHADGESEVFGMKSEVYRGCHSKPTLLTLQSLWHANNRCRAILTRPSMEISTKTHYSYSA